MAKKYPFEVYWYYSTGAHNRGDVYSRHATYKAAESNARKSGYASFLGIREVKGLIKNPAPKREIHIDIDSHNEKPTSRVIKAKRNASPSKITEAKKLYEDFSGHKGDIVGKAKMPDIPHVMIEIGALVGVAYETVRDGKRERYFHEFDAMPVLACSPDGKQLFVLGGKYKFTDRGIVG